jgi:hypothetical protein
LVLVLLVEVVPIFLSVEFSPFLVFYGYFHSFAALGSSFGVFGLIFVHMNYSEAKFLD